MVIPRIPNSSTFSAQVDISSFSGDKCRLCRLSKSMPNFLCGAVMSSGWAKAVSSEATPEKMQAPNGTMMSLRRSTTANDSIHFHSSASRRFARKAMIIRKCQQERPVATIQKFISHKRRRRSCPERFTTCAKPRQAQWYIKVRGMKFSKMEKSATNIYQRTVPWGIGQSCGLLAATTEPSMEKNKAMKAKEPRIQSMKILARLVAVIWRSQWRSS